MFISSCQTNILILRILLRRGRKGLLRLGRKGLLRVGRKGLLRLGRKGLMLISDTILAPAVGDQSVFYL